MYIAQLAEQASIQYPAPRGKSDTPGQWQWHIEDAWRIFVSRTFGVYRRTMHQALVIGQREYIVPDDWKEPIGAVRLWYEPKAISAISRTANVLSVTTTLAHSLSAGMSITLDGVTATGGTTFDGSVTLLTATTYGFTASQEDDNDTGSGGYVQSSGFVELTPKKIANVTRQPDLDPDLTTGTPAYYCYPDPRTIALDPVPDGLGYPALDVEYDASPRETAANNDLAADLPGDTAIAWPGIKARAAGWMGYMNAAEAEARFDEAVRLYRRQASLRVESNRQT